MVGRAVCFQFFAGCPIHATIDHQILASLCHIWSRKSITGFLCTDCTSRKELSYSQSVHSLQSGYCDLLYIQPVSVDPILLKMGTFPPAFLAFPVEKVEDTTWFHPGYLPNPWSGELGLTETFSVFTLFLSDSHSAAIFLGYVQWQL